MLLTNTSQISGIKTTLELDITEEQLERFFNRKENGEYIQNIFPNLTPAEREFILTGISPKEWEQIFGGHE
jgi:hypothetical protein